MLINSFNFNAGSSSSTSSSSSSTSLSSSSTSYSSTSVSSSSTSYSSTSISSTSDSSSSSLTYNWVSIFDNTMWEVGSYRGATPTGSWTGDAWASDTLAGNEIITLIPKGIWNRNFRPDSWRITVAATASPLLFSNIYDLNGNIIGQAVTPGTGIGEVGTIVYEGATTDDDIWEFYTTDELGESYEITNIEFSNGDLFSSSSSSSSTSFSSSSSSLSSSSSSSLS